MNRNIAYFSFFLLVSLISCQAPTSKLFEKLAKEQTRRCPMVIDQYITLDSVVYITDKNINQYYYTLTGVSDNPAAVNDNKEVARQAIIEGIKNEVDMKKYKDYNTTLEYIYYSQREGTVLTRFTILPTEY